MDVSDARYYIQENKEIKGSQMGHTKKLFKKNSEVYDSISPNEDSRAYRKQHKPNIGYRTTIDSKFI
jgi:hypothetical protein